MGSSHDRVKPKPMTLVFGASLRSKVLKTDRLGIRIQNAENHRIDAGY